jgi:outer membrane lipoprotein-sorting protein
VLLAGLTCAALTVFAQAPAWWLSRNVITTNAVPRDFAPLTQGQLKWLATQAAAELDEGLQFVGGAGSNVMALVAAFSPTNNYRPVNLGQVKHVAQPFYARLAALGLTNLPPAGAGRPYPWSRSTNPPNDYAMASIGQAKYAFSFDTAVDSDGDGIPDIWEASLGSNPYRSDAGAVNTNAWALGRTNQDLYQGSRGLSIPNAWALYTNTTQVAVVADIRALSRSLTVKAAECFLDTTNAVIFGSGLALTALDGAFNASNELAQALFTPAFPAGQRHEIFIHAQGSDTRWCPFVKVVLNPNIDDILDKIQANYSAIRDAQFNLTFTVMKNNIVTLSDTVVVKMKGPYKMRKEYSNGLRIIQNENTELWYLPSVGGGAMKSGWNGNPDPIANRDCDFFWDVALWRSRMTPTVTGGGTIGYYAISLNRTAGSVWYNQNAQVDFKHGFVTQLSETDADGSVVMDYQSPMEVLPGVWLFTSHRHTLHFSTGEDIIHESILRDIKVNQSLADSLFTIPTE